MTDPTKQEVVVTDIRLPFGSMVALMVKWAIASIPAFLILVVIGALFWSVIVGMLLSAVTGGARSSFGAPAAGEVAAVTTGKAATAAKSPETNYLSSLTITGLRIEPGSIGGKGVFGEVKNNGDRALSKVEITIYCLNADGKPIFEKTYMPVLVTSMGFGGDNTPLKPGYSRKFGVRLDDAPSEWADKVDAKVTSVEFVESKGGA